MLLLLILRFFQSQLPLRADNKLQSNDSFSQGTEVLKMSKIANPFSSVVDWFRPGTGGAGEAASPVAVEARPREAQQPAQGGGWFFRRRNQKKNNLAQLQRGYEDVVDLMETCKAHMESQAQRADRLLELLEDLPEALRVIPESSRQQARMIEGLQKHLEGQSANTEKLTQAVTGLASATQQHERAMNAIQKQLDANQANGARMVESFSALGDTLGRIGAAHQSGNDLLNTMAETVKQSDDQMRELFNRNQRQTTIMSVVSWTLAITALLVTGYMGVKISQLPIGAPVAAAAPAVTDSAMAAANAAEPTAQAAAATVKAGAIPLPQEIAAPAIEQAAPGIAETPGVEAAVGQAAAAKAGPDAGLTVESVLAGELVNREAAPEAPEATAAEAAAVPAAPDATGDEAAAATTSERPYLGDMVTPEMQAWMSERIGPWMDQIEAASAGGALETAAAGE